MLGEKPAERGLARFAGDEAVRAFGQALGQLGKTPGRQLGRILDRAHQFEAVAARQQDEGEAGLAVEAVRFDQRAVFRAAALGPGLEAALVDEVDEVGLLAPVGDEERGEIGHCGALARIRFEAKAKRASRGY